MVTMGIDIGSTACKCVILEDGAQVLSRAVIPLGTGTSAARRVYDRALEQAGLADLAPERVCATGYGRLHFPQAGMQKSELGCHAAGVRHLLPTARTVIDIGGQDIKVLRLTEAGALDGFVMNDKCAAGTGRFLDMMARVLDVKTEALGPLSAKAQEAVSISSTCTVFAESEVISKLSSGVRLSDLAAGIHASVAQRAAGLAFRAGVRADVALSGGVALNRGVADALSRALKVPVLVHPDCQLAGALGAALLAYRANR